MTFQCSSASRKFLNDACGRWPGTVMPACGIRVFYGFSALQRAENSSMRVRGWLLVYDDLFQCSSASRKFLNRR